MRFRTDAPVAWCFAALACSGCLPVPTFVSRPAFVVSRTDFYPCDQWAAGVVRLEQDVPAGGETDRLVLPFVYYVMTKPLGGRAELVYGGGGNPFVWPFGQGFAILRYQAVGQPRQWEEALSGRLDASVEIGGHLYGCPYFAAVASGHLGVNLSFRTWGAVTYASHRWHAGSASDVDEDWSFGMQTTSVGVFFPDPDTPRAVEAFYGRSPDAAGADGRTYRTWGFSASWGF